MRVVVSDDFPALVGARRRLTADALLAGTHPVSRRRLVE